jgi:hypothetical protein
MKLGGRTDGALHAANHALRTAVGLCVDCDLGDVDTEHFDSGVAAFSIAGHEKDLSIEDRSASDGCGDGKQSPENEDSTKPSASASCPPGSQPCGSSNRLLLYDKRPGGTGACESVYQHIRRGTEGSGESTILARAAALLRNCSCAEGCPSCLLSSHCSTYNSTFDKQGAIVLLEEMNCLVFETSGGDVVRDAQVEGYSWDPMDNDTCTSPLTVEQRSSESQCTSSPGSQQLHARVSAALEPARARNYVIRKVCLTLCCMIDASRIIGGAEANVV